MPSATADDAVPPELQRRVAAGDVDAMVELAQKLEWGELPLEKDELAALELYTKAAAKGNRAAGLNAGLMYLDGRGVDRDPNKAAGFLRQAAAAGNDQAQYHLGAMFKEGGLLPRNDGESLKWFRLAAAQGDPGSVLEVALAYRDGRGVKQDPAEAIAWMKLAEEMGVGQSTAELAALLQQHPKLAAVAMKPRSALAALAVPPAATNVAAASNVPAPAAPPEAPKPRDFSEYGTNLSANVIGFIKRAEAGDLDSEHWVARGFTYGAEGFRKDAAQALAWYRRGAERGDPKGMFILAEFYSQGVPGLGYPNNPTEALAWYNKAADAGYVLAMTSLGSIYSRGNPGLGVQRNDAEGFKWYMRAAEKGNESGQYSVGLFYYEGRGVEKNPAEAVKWLTNAAPQSGPHVKELLARVQAGLSSVPSITETWAPLAREFEKNFAAATSQDARGRAVEQFSQQVVEKSGQSTTAQRSEFVLNTLKPHLERNLAEAGAHVMRIRSLAFAQGDVQRLLPASVQAAVKSHAQQVVANFERSQKLAAELRQLEEVARVGVIQNKVNVADRYLREGQNSPEDRARFRVRALYWLVQARTQGDTTRGALIKTLEADYEDAFDRYLADGSGYKAFYLAEGMIEAGYANAAKESALIMLLGRAGVGKNPDKARELFQKATNLGDAGAAKWIEFMNFSATAADAAKAEQAYQNGEIAAIGTGGKKIDWYDARLWYGVAKAYGHAKADGRLTELTELESAAHAASQPGFAEFQAGSAEYDKKEYAKALLQFMAAAKKGNAEAVNALGVLYEDGTGVDADLATAKKFYEKAKSMGLARAAEGVASVDKTIAQGGLEVETGNRALQKKDYETARKAWLVAAGKGSGVAKFNLGVLDQNGWGVPRSYTGARNWFAKAHEAGLSQAENAVKAMDDAIAKGAQEALDGVTAYEAKKYDEALRLLTSAANKGSSYAAFYLGYYYEQGEAGKKDRQQAIAWYEKSAELGHPEGKATADEVRASAVGADEFDKGKAAYDAKKFTEAVTWYEKSANLGNVRAMATLGSLYQNGAGEIFDDRAKAKYWLKKAVEKGDGLSDILLKSLEDTEYLYAMVPHPLEGPPKGPSLVKGSPWTGDDILAALRRGVDHVSLAVALRTDGADLYSGDSLALQLDPAAATILEHGRLSNALAGGEKPLAGAWAADLANAAIAARRAQRTPVKFPEDSQDLRTKAANGDPAAAYALFLKGTKELKLGPLTGPLARNYEDMAKLALEKNYAPALWVAANTKVNQSDKSKNDPVLQAEYLRRAAEAGDAYGAFKYAELYFAPGDDVAIAPNYAEAEHWFIEAGAGEVPENYTFVKPDFALALLYSMKRPIGMQGTEMLADESSMRWAQELIRRGGPVAEHAKRVIESWRRNKNTGPAAVEGLLKKMSPEVPLWTAAELTKLETAARNGDVATALKLGAAYAQGRGVRQDDSRAVENYRLAAAKGSIPAMRALAEHAKLGHGIKKDIGEHLAWLEKAGAAGDSAAWLEVGDIRQFANVDGGKSRDYAKALVAYDKAIAGGQLMALFNLSIMHENGRGVPKDEAKAMELLKRAAEKGHARSATGLAAMHSQRKEYAEARKWFEKAIAAGDLRAWGSLASTLKSLGQNDQAIAAYQKWLETHPTDFQGFYDLGSLQEKQGDLRGAIASYRKVESIDHSWNTFKELGKNSAERLEEELNPKPGSIVALRQQAEKGDLEATMQLVMKLAPTDKPTALEWLKKAAAKEHPQAMLVLGLETAATDKPAALALIEKAANAGNLEAKFRLGGMKIQGAELPKDVAGGLKLLTEAADAGFPVAQVELGRALVVGLPDIPAAPPRGLEYLKKAAAQNVPQAAGLLGEVYERGVGVPADPTEAMKWYQQAARGGIKEATAAIARLQKNHGLKALPDKR